LTAKNKKAQGYKMTDGRSYLFVSISIFFWASTAALTKILLRDLDSIQILCASTFFASLTLFIYVTFSKK